MLLILRKLALSVPYISYKALIGTLVLVPIVLSLLRMVRNVVRTQLSAARIVPGPGGRNLVLGHIGLIQDSLKGEWHEQMLKEYGHVLKYKAIMGVSLVIYSKRFALIIYIWATMHVTSMLKTDRLMTTDPKALNYIVTNTAIYKRPSFMRYLLLEIVGEGLLSVEGNVHKKQRRILNPAFSSGHIMEMTEIFLSKSQELRDVLLDQIRDATITGAEPAARVNMLAYLAQATLDIIGLAGFNYTFDALSNKQSNFSEAVNAVLHPPNTGIPLGQILKSQVPIFRHILVFDKISRNTRRARTKMDEIGRDLIEKKKNEILAEKAAGDDSVRSSKDLLSLLIRSNMDDRGGGLPDDEVLSQIPTFLLAGHETTSTSTTWTLMSLAIHPDIQTRLRSELLVVPTDTPTMGELDSLVYLDAVVRESLRYHSVVEGLIKVATQDDVIPLEKPFMGKDRKLREVLQVSKGDSFFIPILMMNLSESIWGPDAREFNPERWLNGGPPKAAQAMPSVWGSQMTFMAGPRSCIGFKFALIEMKALLFTLIRALEFELAIPKEEIIRQAAVSRPVVKSEMGKGGQMPMIIRPVPQTA